MSLKTFNPATEDELFTYDTISDHEAASIVDAVAAAQPDWAARSFQERGACFRKLADLLEQRKHPCGTLITKEMGKTIREAEAEVEKCAFLCRHYAEHAERYLADEPVETDAHKSYVAYRPLGTLLAIMPWNFPFWQVLRFGVPALMAGNTAVLKHAYNVTGTALAIEENMLEAGFPENVFRVLLIDVPQVKAVIKHPKIASVSLTGSTKAGQAVGSQAGSVPKRCVLELGGSDPFIVLDDADLKRTIDQGARGRLQANGQSCIAAKRFIVVDAVREPFEEALKKRFESVAMGDPLDPATDLGPMARKDLRDTLHEQVTQSIDQGARRVCGGEVPPGKGAFYPATIIADVRPGMRAYDEELFGPVASILPAKDEDDAIRIANDTSFGLGAVVCSQNRERAEAIARDRIQAGNCFVNAFTRSDPRLPFGGIKGSGFGRELGAHGIRELCNIKTVYVA